jgi:hypothetical protein
MTHQLSYVLRHSFHCTQSPRDAPLPPPEHWTLPDDPNHGPQWQTVVSRANVRNGGGSLTIAEISPRQESIRNSSFGCCEACPVQDEAELKAEMQSAAPGGGHLLFTESACSSKKTRIAQELAAMQNDVGPACRTLIMNTPLDFTCFDVVS